MIDEQIFEIGDWSCSAMTKELEPVEVWAVIEASLDDELITRIKLRDFEVTCDITKRDLFIVKDREELHSFFDKSQIEKIYESALDYAVMRFEQDHKPLAL